SPTRQLLVISESHHRGWQVKIDGQPQPVLRVNGDFLGCVVPQGKHHSQFRFRPTSLQVGAWLSALGVVLAVAVPRWPLRRGAGTATSAGSAVFRPRMVRTKARALDAAASGSESP